MKKKALLILSFSMIVLGSVAQIPTDSLLIFYPFSGNANDISNSQLHGIVNGAILTKDRFGVPNSAYYFDGIDDFIELPNVIKLKPKAPVSFSFWVKLESLEQVKNQFVATNSEIGNYGGCIVNVNQNNYASVGISAGDNSGVANPTGRRSKYTSLKLSVGIWYHIVSVYRGSTDMSIFINGSEVSGTYEGSGGELAYSQTPGTIGKVNQFNYWGSLDDFAYYNKALDSSEVIQLFTLKDCQVTTYDSISVTDTLIIDVILAEQIPNNVINTIKVFPNPTLDVVHINTANYAQMEDYRIKIIDGAGKEIFNSLCNQPEFQIDLSSFGDAGLYFIKIIDNQDKTIHTRKILLQ